MAESGGGWWGSWYTAAKNKSAEVLEFVRRDLDEISSAVSIEASNVVSSTASVIKDKLNLEDSDSTASTVKRSISSFLGQVSNVLNPVPEDEDEEAMVIQGSEPIVIDRVQARLFTLTADPATFLVDPVEAREYEAWLGVIGEGDGEGIMAPEKLSALMAACPRLHEQYNNLVPNEVSHCLFWHRYLFRKALLEDEEARKEAKRKRELERAKMKESEAAKVEPENWDHAFQENESFAAGVEISEEEQARLLSEYEKECREEAEKRKAREAEESRRAREGVGLEGSLEDGSLLLDANHYQASSPSKKGSNSKGEAVVKVGENLNLMRIKERRDMVLIEGQGDGSFPASSTSSGDKESTDGDWEKEFDLEDVPSNLSDSANNEIGLPMKCVGAPTTG